MFSEQNPRRRAQLTLRTHVPRAGFLWAARGSVLVQERHDRVVLNALRDLGGVALLAAGAQGAARHQVERVLADTFRAATDDAEAGRIDELETPLDWVAELRTRLPWAELLEEDIFLELFLRLCRARLDWHASPREPFNTKEHGPLAHAIDGFHLAARDGWAAPHDGLFMGALPLVGGTGAEERAGEDPVAAAPHTQGTGAFAAAGEPHPQTLSASGGAREKDEDGDVRMDDGDGEEGAEGEGEGVREVRQRLAGTSLGEEMEMGE